MNGWNRENLEYESEETFAESAVKCFEDSQRFSTEWKLNPCGKDKYYSETDGKKYHLSRSPFWNYSRYIWKKLARGVEAEGEGDWLKYIAWSNLYKVSPRCGGNPDNLLCSMQAKTCIDILRAEIQLLNPTHILMPVSESWFSWSRGDFSSIFRDGSLGLKEKCISSGDFRLVKRIFESDSLKIVVTNRPERRKRAEYVVEVMRAFDGKVGF